MLFSSSESQGTEALGPSNGCGGWVVSGVTGTIGIVEQVVPTQCPAHRKVQKRKEQFLSLQNLAHLEPAAQR